MVNPAIQYPPGIRRIRGGEAKAGVDADVVALEIFERRPRYSGAAMREKEYLSHAAGWPMAAYYHDAVLNLEIDDIAGYTNPDLKIIIEDSVEGETYFVMATYTYTSVTAGPIRKDIDGPFGPWMRIRLVLDGTLLPQFISIYGTMTYRRRGSCSCGGGCAGCRG